MRNRKRRVVKLPDALPEDVLLGLPRVTLRGNARLNLENHQGILVYHDTLLRARTSLGILTIEGKGLVLDALGERDLLLRGTIDAVRFEQ